MRRSKESSAEQEARGNFTPPSRAAMSPADVPVTPPPTAAATGSTSKLSPRNWRVPTRLNAILLIPVLVGLVMGGFQVKGSIDTWQEAQDAEKTALIVRAASEYSTALLNERDLTAAPLLAAKSAEDRKSDEVTQAYAATDAARAKFDEAAKNLPSGQGLERRLRLFKDEEPKLDALRKAAYTRSLDPVNTQLGYTSVQHYLTEFSNELGLGTGNVTSYGRSVYAVQLAKGAESLQRSIGTQLLVRPSRQEAVFAQQSVAFNSYNYLEQIALGEFSSGGMPEDVELLKKVMAGKAADGAKQMQAAGVELPKGKDGSVYSGVASAIGTAKDPDGLAALKSKGITAETWMAVATAKFEGYTEVEKALVDKAVAEAVRISDESKTDAWVNGGIVVVALLAAFILAGMMARQMSRSMQQLRTAAFGIAEQRLPMLVDQLSRTEPGRVDTRVQPIPIDSQDEIGEVARAFDQVHREAVRLAAEQAMLRGNVNAIFTNLSRRNQSLIEGQLTLITDLENNEADPDQLENLFKLDHLATRMRRNGENLLVLAGEEPGRRWDQPVPLVDVMRAASSEVEQYERIELAGVPDAEIHGQAVTDLVHLLAELLENATTFSSPQTKVRVTATRLPDGRVMVEIHDKGIGLTAEDFADINHKLANPPTVDAAVSQRMGLFVVGRLADRHGIRVQLRPSGEQAGTTSLVMLPDAITHGGGGEQPLQDDFTVSQIIPRQQQNAFEAAPQQQMLTAADLGFDDSRYEQPAEEELQLDPVNRSLNRRRPAAVRRRGRAGRGVRAAAPGVRPGVRAAAGAGVPGGAVPGAGLRAAAAGTGVRPGVRGRLPAAGRLRVPAAGLRGVPAAGLCGSFVRDAGNRTPAVRQYVRSPVSPGRVAGSERLPERLRPGVRSGIGICSERSRTGPRTRRLRPSGPGPHARPGCRPRADRRRSAAPRQRRPAGPAGAAAGAAAAEARAAGTAERSRRFRRMALDQRRALAAGREAQGPEGGRGHLVRSSPTGPEGQPGRGHGGADAAGRPPGLPRSRGRTGQVEQPAPGRPAGTQRGNGHERIGPRPGQYLQPGALV